MAHMFRVDFITNHVNGMVESGKALVVAESHEQAQDLICRQLKLPPSRTRFPESSKVKPPLYTIDNRQSYPDTKHSVRTQREPAEPVQRYFVAVTASNVNGYSEQQVMRKVGEELCARGAHTKLRHNIEMSVDVSTSRAPTKSPGPMEKIEMYGARNGSVQGGRVRGR